MTNLETYIQEAESQGSKHCVVPVDALKALLEVAEAAKNMIGDKSIELKLTLKKLKEARRG